MTQELPPPGGAGPENVLHLILRAALAIPGAKINRKAFLRKELRTHVTPEVLNCAIETSPAKAGIPKGTIRRLAISSIRWHRSGVSSTSFVVSIPGGLSIVGAVPADLAQFFWHVLVVVQKLAYLHGWPDLVGEDQQLDDETLMLLIIFLGVMFGVESAAKILSDIAERLAAEVLKRLPREALTKWGFFLLAREIAKWIGIRLTKQAFARIVSKAIPIISGFVSGTITWISFSIMAHRLRKHLESLPLANANGA